MSLSHIVGYVSCIVMLIPIIIIGCCQLYRNRCLLVLMFYYSITFFYNICSVQIILLPQSVTNQVGMFNNLLDTPLMLTYMLYFVRRGNFRKNIHITILAFLLFEVLVVLFFGITDTAITIILGPGIIIVLLFASRFFVEQVKITIQKNKSMGKAILAAAALFAYGCYFIIYFFWYVLKTPNVDDTFLVYFFVLIFSSIAVAIGLIAEKKRFKELDAIMRTREELNVLYREDKAVIKNMGDRSFDKSD